MYIYIYICIYFYTHTYECISEPVSLHPLAANDNQPPNIISSALR